MVATLAVKINRNDFGKLQKAAPQKAGRALRALAYSGLTHAKLLIQQSPATGAEYPRGGKTHTASAPGNPPRSDSGTLYNSMHVVKGGKFLQKLVDGVDYGVHLEFGTDDMEARPFFGPTVVYMEEEAPSVFRDFLK